MRVILLLAVGLMFQANAADQTKEELSANVHGPESVPSHEVPEIRAQIEEVRSTLKRETYEQSIENLITNHGQFFPAPVGNFRGFEQLRLALSSRRSIKVLQTLEELPQEARVEKCKELFDQVMVSQKENFESRFRLDMESESSSQRPPNLILPLCISLLATAETGRRDVLAEQLNKLDEYQRYVEQRIRNSDSPYEEWTIEMLIWQAIPDDGFLLNALRVVAMRDPDDGKELLNEVDSYCRSVGMDPVEQVTVPWDAQTTTFEERVGSRADTSKGTRTYELYFWDNQYARAKQRAILREVQRMVLGSAPQ